MGYIPAGAPAGDAGRSAGRLVGLELRVRNHPGTMSHLTGLFARRAFNLDAIVCAPIGDGTMSCVLLLVAGGPRLEQIERQLARLYDVASVRLRPDLDAEFFARLVASASASRAPDPTGETAVRPAAGVPGH